jgi:uncharacterized protein YecE (DUF72 family)
MEFGRVNEKELARIDFGLPAEPVRNNVIINDKPAKSSYVYTGCAKWGISEWQGKLYPPKTRKIQFLDHYLQQYNALELNLTHYEIYAPKTITAWAEKAAGRAFLFCPKLPRVITHEKLFLACEPETAAFLNGIRAFGAHLGPVFLQVSEQYGPDKKQQLFTYLATLPRDLRFFVEVRNAKWFEEPVCTELYSTLQQLQMGWVITDVAGKRHCAHMHVTLPEVFIRFTGNSLHATDFTRIDEWAVRIKHWLNNGLQKLYFFMHMHDEAYSPELSVYLTDKLNEVCGLALPRPKILKPGLLARGTPIRF